MSSTAVSVNPYPTIDDDQTGLSPYYRIYRTGDERWIAVAAVGPAAKSRLLAALQCDEAGLETAIASGTAAETLALLRTLRAWPASLSARTGSSSSSTRRPTATPG